MKSRYCSTLSTSCVLLAIINAVVLQTGKSDGADNDLVFTYQNTTVSFAELKQKLKLAVYWSPSKCPAQLPQAYSCKNRCSKTRAGLGRRPCYCDPECKYTGDCCYDYIRKCSPRSKWIFTTGNPRRACLKLDDKLSYWHMFIKGCPNNYPTAEMITKCASVADKNNLVSGIPVFDMRTKTSYRNVYCASCNGAKNWTFWSVRFRCERLAPGLRQNMSNEELMKYAKKNCKPTYEPSVVQRPHLSVCLPRDERCPIGDPTAFESPKSQARVLCALYSLPYDPNFIKRRNPHCALCRSENITPRECMKIKIFLRKFKPVVPPPPALTILFNVKNRNHYKISLSGILTRTSKGDGKCSSNQVLDPFTLKCSELPRERKPVTPPTFLLSPGPMKNNNTRINTTALSRNNTSSVLTRLTALRLRDNCTLARVNTSKISYGTNGSIIVKYNGIVHEYSNGSYVIHESYAYFCSEFSRNGTALTNPPSTKVSPLQIITYIGTAMSILAEIALLVLYVIRKNFRNTPGRILMSLVSCLLIYQVFFLMIGLTNVQGFCVAVAVIVHYFLLTSFLWMAVMAFDVMRTFGTKAVRRHSSSCSTFVKYCCVSYGVSGVIVMLSIILDKTDAVAFEYGQGAVCWILGRVPLIVTLHVPVAMVILFNTFALTWTMVGIRRTNKLSNLAIQSNQTTHNMNQVLLGIKLSSVMGFTWIFGIIAGFVSSLYVAYPYVILNSLQGFFILVAFTANKRNFKLLLTKIKRRTPGSSVPSSIPLESSTTKQTKV